MVVLVVLVLLLRSRFGHELLESHEVSFFLRIALSLCIVSLVSGNDIHQ
jgi:hypothetical protein